MLATAIARKHIPQTQTNKSHHNADTIEIQQQQKKTATKLATMWPKNAMEIQAKANEKNEKTNQKLQNVKIIYLPSTITI